MSITPQPADVGRGVVTNHHLGGTSRAGTLFSYNTDHGYVRFPPSMEPEQILLHHLDWNGCRDEDRRNPSALDSGWFNHNKVPVPEEHRIPVVGGRMGYT